jgi:hypothetical protein
MNPTTYNNGLRWDVRGVAVVKLHSDNAISLIVDDGDLEADGLAFVSDEEALDIALALQQAVALSRPHDSCTNRDKDHSALRLTCGRCIEDDMVSEAVAKLGHGATEAGDNEIDFAEIVDALNRATVPAFVDHSGGGCQTIYIGTSYVDAYGDQRHPCLIGPGTLTHGRAVGDLTDLFVGHDDDGNPNGGLHYSCTAADTVDSIVAKAIEYVDASKALWPRFRVVTQSIWSRVYDAQRGTYVSDSSGEQAWSTRDRAQAVATRMNQETN